MSSFGTKSHHHHPQLRRQKTCFEVGSTNSNKLRDNTSTVAANTAASVRRGFCLQRQLSVDATSVIVNPAKYVSAYEKNNLISNSTNDLSWKFGSNTSINHGDHHASPKTTAVPIIKKRSTQATSVSSSKIAEQETTDRHKKALKDRGNRLNLNIFLSHSTNSQDGDINGSDAESSNESITIVSKENNNMAKTDVQSNCSKASESNSNNNNNISNDSDNSSSSSSNNNNQVPVKKVPDANATNTKPANSRRPPLVRAMSAPIRPKHDDTAPSSTAATDSTTKAIQVKRKIKKKKVIVSRDSREDILEEKFYENDNELDDVSNSSDSASNVLASSTTNLNISTSSSNSNSSSSETKKPTKSVKKPTLQRPRSAAVGNEVVTLVSLLSSGGSDSEKEDNHTTTTAGSATTTAVAAAAPNKSDIIDFNARHRAPLLRKSGKSVSFQERDLLPEIPTSTKDFSKYRRGSVAPLAARIRSNRPPTAPAGSIYLCDIDINNDDFIKSIKTFSTKNILSGDTSYDIDTDNANNNNRNENKNVARETRAADEVEETEITYPENVRTPKEKECWKLYQKMLNRGVTVSYDTILRGMLTPTELRMIQKQNESRKSYDIMETNVCDGSGSSTPAGMEQNVASTLNKNSSSSNSLKELEND